MARVLGTYPDFTKIDNKAHFRLNCDKTMAPGYWLAPIKWKGVINGVEVEFNQTSESGFAEYHYDFSSFPQEVREAIPYVVKAIDDAMRVMD